MSSGCEAVQTKIYFKLYCSRMYADFTRVVETVGGVKVNSNIMCYRKNASATKTKTYLKQATKNERENRWLTPPLYMRRCWAKKKRLYIRYKERRRINFAEGEGRTEFKVKW